MSIKRSVPRCTMGASDRLDGGNGKAAAMGIGRAARGYAIFGGEL